MPESTENETEKENILSRRLNKILETRLENDQVNIFIYLLNKKHHGNIYRTHSKLSKSYRHFSPKTRCTQDVIYGVKLKNEV